MEHSETAAGGASPRRAVDVDDIVFPMLGEPFRRAIDDATIGLGLADTDGTLLRVNRAFSRMAGRPHSEVNGADLFALTHVEDRERLGAYLDGVRRNEAAKA